MLRKTINEILEKDNKPGLLIEDKDKDEIAINPNLPEEARNPELGDRLLPNTLAYLFLLLITQMRKILVLFVLGIWHRISMMLPEPGKQWNSR
jgi:hypothetical protein